MRDVLISAANSMSWTLFVGWLRSLRLGALSLVGEPVEWFSSLEGLADRYSIIVNDGSEKRLNTRRKQGTLDRISKEEQSTENWGM